MSPRWSSLVSLLVATILLESYLWWGKFQYAHRRLLTLTIVGFLLIVVVNHWRNHDTLYRLGLRFDNWLLVLRHYFVTTAALFALIFALGLGWGKWSPVPLLGAASYLGWAAVQQHLLQNFYRLRIEESLTSLGIPGKSSQRRAVFAAALVFALLHWPNLPLVGLTFLGGLLWCTLFRRTPSLWGAAASQTALTIALMGFFKFGVLNSFEVGAAGKRFDYYGEGVRVAAGYDAEGKALIATLPGPDRGHPSRVRIFNQEGHLIREWTAFPEYGFSGEIAMGNLLPGAGDEVAVAPGPGYANPPLLRIFSVEGERLLEIDLSADLPSFGAWVSIACGKLYVGAGPGPGFPQTLLEVSAGGDILRTLTFEDLPLENGLRGSAICSSPQLEPPPILMWGSDLATNPSTLFLLSAGAEHWTPIPTLKTTFGVQVTPFHLAHQPGLFALSPGPLRGYPGVVQFQTLDGEMTRFITFDTDPARYGNSLASVDLDGDGNLELVLGEGTGPKRAYEVQLRSADGQLLATWEAYPEKEWR